MADEAANQKRVKFFFVHSSDLDAVKLDDDEKVDGAETLLELLQAPIADPCLEALRRIMSLTYFESLERTSELRVRDIRALAMKPLGDLGKELEALKLPRVDADRSFEHDHSPQVFQYNIVPAKELRRRVKVEGSWRRQSLDEIFKHSPADPAIRTLREILSVTFREPVFHAPPAPRTRSLLTKMAGSPSRQDSKSSVASSDHAVPSFTTRTDSGRWD